MAPPSLNTSCCSLPPTFLAPSSWLHPAPFYLSDPLSQSILSRYSAPQLPNVYCASIVVRAACCKEFYRLVTKTATGRKKAAPELGGSMS